MTSPATPIRVVGLHLYPVKSLAGVAVDQAAVSRQGLLGDRRWAVVDPTGENVTAREVHLMLGLRAEPTEQGGIRLLDRHGATATVAPPREASPIAVLFSGQDAARPAGRVADDWLSERLGQPVRLVWQDDQTHRPIQPEMGGRSGDTSSLADAAPVHVTTEASLRRLNEWLAESDVDPLGHDRFRPNVVLDGDEPFAEDGWRRVRIGEVDFRYTMACDRCVMATIDRQALATAKEPIRTLARHRRWEGSTWFGIRLTPVLPLPPGAVLAVGDKVVAHRVAATSGIALQPRG
ncbi:MAG: MOSC domain-containing protein [Humibacillus sp.]|nr:MOSC domain-containing protein [Humibacillus sp.]MDN5776835.1 MOSC domain-containing protein [Humibacillus sp.]